jgi:hypothetical protein
MGGMDTGNDLCIAHSPTVLSVLSNREVKELPPRRFPARVTSVSEAQDFSELSPPSSPLGDADDLQFAISLDESGGDLLGSNADLDLDSLYI